MAEEVVSVAILEALPGKEAELAAWLRELYAMMHAKGYCNDWLYRDSDRPAVWVYDPHTQQVQLRLVSIAQYREDGAVVRDGVRGGEWVVAAGVHKLTEGQKVRPYDGGAAAGNESPQRTALRAQARS